MFCSLLECCILILAVVFLVNILLDSYRNKLNDVLLLKYCLTYFWDQVSGGKILVGDCLQVNYDGGYVFAKTDYFSNVFEAKCTYKMFKLLKNKFMESEKFLITNLTKNSFEVHLKSFSS